MKTIEYMNNIFNCMKGLENRKEQLNRELATVNQLQQDIIHEIENEDKRDFMRAWAFVKAIKTIRSRRRNIKNEIEILNNANNNLIKIKEVINKTNFKMKKDCDTLKYLKTNKVYKNRIGDFSGNIEEELSKCLGNNIEIKDIV